MTLRQEVWQQDSVDDDLWEGEGGLLVNTAALDERAYYFGVVRVPAQPKPAVEAIPGPSWGLLSAATPRRAPS